MKRTVRMLCAFLSATMLVPSQALAADAVSEPQAEQPSIVINEVESDATNKGNDWGGDHQYRYRSGGSLRLVFDR